MRFMWIVAGLALGLAGCATKAADAPAGQEGHAAVTSPGAASSAAYPVSDTFTPQRSLNVCPGMIATNVPARDGAGRLETYSPFIRVEGVVIAVAPVNGACLSSGFGVRGERLHKGIDLYSREPLPIHAAGDGKVVEAGYRDDYGNYAVIDHGGGVFTRYAHLSVLEDAVAENAGIAFGAPLGLMGNTASYPIPVHLHYEVLTGDYNTQKKSFGLEAVDPLAAVFVEVD